MEQSEVIGVRENIDDKKQELVKQVFKIIDLSISKIDEIIKNELAKGDNLDYLYKMKQTIELWQAEYSQENLITLQSKEFQHLIGTITVNVEMLIVICEEIEEEFAIELAGSLNEQYKIFIRNKNRIFGYDRKLIDSFKKI